VPDRFWGRGAVDVLDLSPEEKVLVIIRDELYGGDWDDLLSDLNARLAGRPYVVKLATRIEQDIERVERLRRLEQEKGIDLADYVEGSQENE